jgi:hypothetical protein
MIELHILMDGKEIVEILDKMPSWEDRQREQRRKEEQRKILLDMAYDQLREDAE